jgi:DNA-binding MarR family transcriptional regulator
MVVIRPTRKGRALVSRIEKVLSDLADVATAGLSERERNSLVALLERVRANLPSPGYEASD